MIAGALDLLKGVMADAEYSRTADWVCRNEVASEDLETRRTIGSMIHRSPAGMSRLSAIASSWM